MSRLRQRRLGQLRQTIDEKVKLLQRQKAELISVLDEYIGQAESMAVKLLSSQEKEAGDDLYLDVICQLDRRSQVCVQLTSKTYDIIDANEDETDVVSNNSGQPSPQSEFQDLDSDNHCAPGKDKEPTAGHQDCSSKPPKTEQSNNSKLQAVEARPDVSVSKETPHPQQTNAVPDLPSPSSSLCHPLISSALPSEVGLTQELSHHCHPLVSNSEELLQVPPVLREPMACTAVDAEVTSNRLPEGKAVKVIVSAVENPSSFYVLTSEQDAANLSAEIRKYTQQNLPCLEIVEKGTLCLAKYTDNFFYRAYIQYVLKENVGVFFIDFGNIHTCQKNMLLALPLELQTLPALAIHCCLAGVMPTSKSGLWPDEAINLFSQSVNQWVICEVLWQPPPASAIPAVVNLMWPTSPTAAAGVSMKDMNISLSIDLIIQNVAQAVDLSTLKSFLLENNGSLCPAADSEATNNTTAFAKSATASGGQIAVSTEVNTTSETNGISCELHTTARKSILLHPTSSVCRPKKDKSFALRSMSDGRMRPFQRMIFRSLGLQNERRESVKLKEMVSEKGHKQHGQQDVMVSQEEMNVGSSESALMERSLTQNGSYIQNAGSESTNNESHASLSSSLHNEPDIFKERKKFRALGSLVLSPTDFYLHKVCRSTGRTLLHLMESLNKKLEETPTAILQHCSENMVLEPGVLCCARFTKDNQYYRALVLETKTPSALSASTSLELNIKVFYIDYGDTEWLTTSQVFPLPENFHAVPPQALWCSLAFVQPAGGERLKSKWLVEATSAFEEMMGQGNKVLTVIVMSGDIPENTCRGDAVQKSPLQVILIDDADDDLCINHELVLRGHAKLNVTSSSIAKEEQQSLADAEEAKKLDDEDDDLWDGMKEDANSLRNTYNVDVTDVGVALTGIKESGWRRAVCKYFNRPSQCWKGDKCNWLHVKPGLHTNMSGNLRQVLVYNEDQSEILPKAGTYVIVEVSTVLNPNHFYVLLPWGPHTVKEVKEETKEVLDYVKMETLQSLKAAMQEFYKNKRLDTDYSVYGNGEAVAVKSRREWFRGKVIDTDPDKEEVEVLYIDFGNTEWVSEHDIRHLELQFIHLPPQAVECSLNRLVPRLPAATWPDAASARFLSLVEGKTLVAYVVKSMFTGRLVVDLIDTSGDQDVNIADLLIHERLASPATENGSDGNRDRIQKTFVKNSQLHYVPG